jgi:hypothetical protein
VTQHDAVAGFDCRLEAEIIWSRRRLWCYILEVDSLEVEVHGEDLIILRERDVHAVAAERIEESIGLYL